MAKQKNFPNRVEARRKGAAERQAVSDALTTSQKLEALDQVFGADKGAVKVRIKLHKRLGLEKLTRR